MSALWGHVIGVVTVILMATFIGIWIWAWRPRHRPVFDELAQIPMQDGRASTERKEASECCCNRGPEDRGPTT